MFNINDLKKNYLKREETNKKIYKNVLQKCYNRIEYTNGKLNDKYVLYEIPCIIFGSPMVNKKQCSQYLIQNLIKNGFKVKYLGNGCIFISWKHIYEDDKPILKKKLIKDKTYKNYRSVNDVPKSDKFFL